ncbi:MAG: type II secretory ATPase GspE/PulE/Tfp pilus assembly ATPase PilB-like protein [Alphaproteobacteria bacterium]|jgi:type II secretory ATPase GspE/PulE/Tfp pilus assembly ATPase PilB-like protein
MLTSNSRPNLIQTLQTIVEQHITLDKAFEHIEPFILNAFTAKRLSIFQRRSHHKDLVARHKTGSETREVKVTINTQSIAGYVAMAQQPVVVNNPYDDDSLKKIHFKLRFEKKFDRISRFKTTSILCVPIKENGVLLGVMQIFNKEDGFSAEDVGFALDIAQVLGSKYKFELGGTARPFDYLIHKEILDAKVLDNLNHNTSIKHLAYLLHNEHQIPESDLCEALSVYYQVPFIDYLPAEFHLSQGYSKLNVSYLKRNSVAIIRDNREQPIVLMFEPNNTALLMEIESALGVDNYQLAFSFSSQILQYLEEKKARPNASDFDEIIGEIDSNTIEEEVKESHFDQDEPVIVRLVSSILFEAKRMNASDIHIDPEPNKPTLVRMRIDGEVRDINQIPRAQHNAIIARIKIMSSLNIAEKRIPQDGKLVFDASGQTIDVRVATIPTVEGEGVVMRLLAGSDVLPIDKINLSPRNLSMLQSIVSMPHGIMLVVGPTGSGKTTTLHAILGHLNTPNKKIWTAEDPVEITQYRLQQVQINPKVGFTFAVALRAFLRADPDIILIGEMRDKETASAGIEASLTGHLVLSTLHTNSAPETITRLLDLGMDPVNFADACVGILAQRLVRVLCNNCKEQYTPDENELAFLNRQYGEEFIDEITGEESHQLCKAVGCFECNDTGYKGRTGVHELLPMTPQLRGLVYKESSIAEIKKQALQDGMRTLTQDVIIKVLKGETDIVQAQILTGAGMWSH